MSKVICLGLTVLLMLAGCSSSSELKPGQQEELKNNFSRSLTKEEIEHMNKANAAPPDAKKK